MFRFEYHTFFFVLALIPVLAAILWLSYIRSQKILKKIGSIASIAQLIPGYNPRNVIRNSVLMLIAAAFVIISGTNPQWGTKRETVKSESSDIIIALDISNSMLAEDIAPSRMERSKRFTQSLVQSLKGNRIGLILFAGGAYLQSPLTNDFAAVNLMVKSASPSQAGTQGTAIGEALELAEETFLKGEVSQRAVIVITDGEDHDENALQIASKLKENGTITYTIGVGTEEGGLIPIQYNGRKLYKKDEAGNPVKTQLNVSLINELAKAGGGRAFLVNDGKAAISKLIKDIDKLEKREVQQKSFSEYNSYFQYFLGIGILFLGLGLFLPIKSKNA